MSLIRVSADNPAALLAVAVLLFVLGIVGIASLPIQMLPNLEYPEININTSWRNAAPQEVEANIVEPQEMVLRQVPGVVEMSSFVRPGNGRVHRVFDIGTDLQKLTAQILALCQNLRAPEQSEIALYCRKHEIETERESDSKEYQRAKCRFAHGNMPRGACGSKFYASFRAIIRVCHRRFAKGIPCVCKVMRK